MEDTTKTTKSSANAGFSFIELLKPRYKYENPDKMFLVARKYPLIRDIEGLGWLVQSNYDNKQPQYTLIGYNQGVKG